MRSARSRLGSVLLSAFAFWAAIGPGALPARADLFGPSRIPASYRSWTLEKTKGAEKVKVSQLYVPLVTSLRFGESADLVLSTSAASSALDRDVSGNTSLGGAADLTAQIYYRLSEDRLLVQAGVNLPSGRTGLNLDEFAVAQALGSPLLGFHLKRPGEGFDVSGAAVWAVPIGARTTFALGAGAVQRGAYKLVAGGPDFKPGPEVSFSAGVDVLGGRDAPPSVRVDATYRIFGRDEYGSADVFEEGNQLEAQAAAATRTGHVELSALLRVVTKGDNTSYSPEDVTSTSPGQVTSTVLAPGTEILSRVGAGVDVSRTAALGLEAEWNHFGGSDPLGGDSELVSLRNGDAYGIGPTFRLSLLRAAAVKAKVAYLRGTLQGEGEFPDRDLKGLEVSVALLWNPAL
jgi:hypothetical protein